MADSDVFMLGFGVDTGPMAQAKAMTDTMAKAMNELAVAMKKEEEAALASAAADARKAAAAREAADATKRSTDAAILATKAQRDLAAAVEASKGSDQAAAKAAQDSIAALSVKATAATAAAEAEARAVAVARSAAAQHTATAAATGRAAMETRAATEAARGMVDAQGKGRASGAALADTLGTVSAGAHAAASRMGVMTANALSMATTLGTGGAAGLNQGLQQASQGFAAVGGMMGGVVGISAGVTAGVLGISAAFGGLIAATAAQQEKFSLLEGRLKNVYGSAAAAAEVFGRLTELANKNGLSIDATTESFLRMARNNDTIGLTTDQLLDMTDAVQKLGRVSGASQGETAGAMMQFSQALAAGKLSGDELRSIMENMPALVKTIADGLGVSVGQIKAMGSAGELTSDKITGAILRQLPEINRQFSDLPDTSTQAFQRVANNWDVLMGHMGEKLNASNILQGFAKVLEGTIQLADMAIAPATSLDRYNAAVRDRDVGFMQGGNPVRAAMLAAENANRALGISWDDSGPDGGGLTVQEQQIREAQTELSDNAKVDMINRQKEMLKGVTSPVARSEAIMKDLDDQAKKTGELTSQLKGLEDAYAQFSAHPLAFDPETTKRMEKMPMLIAAVRSQIANTLPVMDEYRNKTDLMFKNMLQFGAGGAASIGEEAAGLAKSMAAKGQAVLLPNGQDITQQMAENAVIERKTQGVLQQTQAMELQIDAQEALAGAVGKGTAAQIEQQVAQKALDVQMQNFGATLNGPAASAMDGFTAKYRELLQAQNDATDAQKLFNTQVQLGIEAQIDAAIRMGATAGELAALRQTLTTSQDFGMATQGAASEVVLNGGSAIPPIYGDMFDRASQASGVPVAVLAAIAKAESGFDPNAVGHDPNGNPAGRGMMQILPSTAADPGYGVAPMSKDDLFDPEKNIMFGAQYFAGKSKALGFDISSPTGLRKALNSYNGGADVWGGDPAYADKVIGNLPLGAQVAEGGARLDELKGTQSFDQKIADLQKQIADQKRLGAAGSVSDVVKAQREIAIRDAGNSGRDDAEKQALMDQQRALFAAQDEASQAEILRTQEAQLDTLQKQQAIAKLAPRERKIELEVLEEINAQKDKGLSYDEAAIRAAVTARVDATDGLTAATEASDRWRNIWIGAAGDVGSSIESAIRQGMMEGTIDGKKLLLGLVADITISIQRAFITKPLTDNLTNLLSTAAGSVAGAAGAGVAGAHGLVLGDGGPTMMYAHGGVIDRPTTVRMAHGGALIGEAGPEAVLPLKRGPDGRLGVGGGSGGGVALTINDYRTTEGSKPVEVEEKIGPDGGRAISLTIRDEMRQQTKSGAMDGVMQSSYGLTRQTTMR